ncbi:hypothetical protein pmac_cds_689 [Pandoravirus macleodensis]|uniref:F-box incomplete domain containing protein n=1 Tax=Pandoravirus macleodensis TaxID=2107707 RepID=A0A2U7UFX0_9VIRU|nr:hypothetical protein pmac_cds_689 [Pandoravirus macleodensis]AVK77377.1 hypothetical protein pmac_cds_689 [Pandoravirus macleodensis]
MTEQDADVVYEVRLGDWDSLPVELAVRILNGYSDNGDDDSGTHRRRARRSFFDPRWRFAARAVNRQWRAIIEHPTPAEATAMGKHPHKRWNVVHVMTPVNCPKWPTGRVVCLSAVAKWIASDATPWLADPETFYVWCARTCGATRKHVIAALFASGQAWAINQALDHHWSRLAFEAPMSSVDRIKSAVIHSEADGDAATNAVDIWACMDAVIGDRSVDDNAFCVDSLSTARIYGEYDDWDKDDGGDAEGLIQVLLDVSLYMGETIGHDALCRRFSYRDCHPSFLTLVRYGHAHLLERAIRAGLVADDYVWDAAAIAKDPACLECLLALVAEKVLPLPESAQNARQPPWIDAAVRNGRIDALALCDRYGVAFDHVEAFLTAATYRRPEVMAWLWHRQTIRRCEPPLNLDLAADVSINRHPSRQTLSIEWICAEGRWTPHPEALVGLVDRACLNDAFECALFLIQRWTRVFFDRASARDIARIFAIMTRYRCAPPMVMRFVDMINCHSVPTDLDRLNLWPALFDITIVDYGRAWRNWACIACAFADGEVPSARDVNAISPRTENPCLCAFDPEWRHVAGHDHYKPVPDGPCTPDQANLLAPLARWVRPEPVALPFPPQPREVLTQGWDWDGDEYCLFYDFLKGKGLIAVNGTAP